MSDRPLRVYEVRWSPVSKVALFSCKLFGCNALVFVPKSCASASSATPAVVLLSYKLRNGSAMENWQGVHSREAVEFAH